MSRKRKTKAAAKVVKTQISKKSKVKKRKTAVPKSSKMRASKLKVASRQGSLAEKTEQILLTMPKIIATQIAKDLAILKQRESKTKTEQKKIEAQRIKLHKQGADLRKKNTPATKKRLKKTQLSLKKQIELLEGLTQAVTQIQKQTELLTEKREKYSALHTQLQKFDKEWSKKPLKKKMPKKTTVKKASLRKTKLEAPFQTIQFAESQRQMTDDQLVLEKPETENLSLETVTEEKSQ